MNEWKWWVSKEEVCKPVVSKFPELNVYFNQDRKWKEKYQQNMTDAVALGLTHLKKGFRRGKIGIKEIGQYISQRLKRFDF